MAIWSASEVEMKRELVRPAQAGGANRRELARRFKMSPTTLYQLVARFEAEGEAGLAPRSRRPKSSPTRTPAALEAAVLAARAAHPTWGGRKIHHALKAQGLAPPAPSTITAILRRGGLALGTPDDPPARTRFERAAPNELWQMDFKGHVAMAEGRLHPLTVLDDHSRYAIALQACADQQAGTVRRRLIAAFERCGRPEAMLMDNGAPWGDSAQRGFTAFSVWLLERDIAVIHARPRHPQTLGKDERFHRTLAQDAMAETFADLGDAQAAFDRFCAVYNQERPHEALGYAVPASRYVPSPRPWRDTIEPFAYGPEDALRRVCQTGRISFAGRRLKISKAFAGKTVALRPTETDGVYQARFRNARIAEIDLKAPAE